MISEKLNFIHDTATLKFCTSDLAQLFFKKCQNADKNGLFLKIIFNFLYGYSNSVIEAKKISFFRGGVKKSTLLLDNPKKISPWEENKFLDYPKERKIPREKKVPRNANSDREFCANLGNEIPSDFRNIFS